LSPSCCFLFSDFRNDPFGLGDIYNGFFLPSNFWNNSPTLLDTSRRLFWFPDLWNNPQWLLDISDNFLLLYNFRSNPLGLFNTSNSFFHLEHNLWFLSFLWDSMWNHVSGHTYESRADVLGNKPEWINNLILLHGLLFNDVDLCRNFGGFPEGECWSDLFNWRPAAHRRRHRRTSNSRVLCNLLQPL